MQNPLERARHLIALNRPEGAIPLIVDFLRESPEDSEALALLGVAFFHCKEYEQALQYAEKASAAAPLDEHPHRLRAFVLLTLKRKREALKAAQEAVRCEPESSRALWVLAQVYLALHKWSDALSVAETFIQLHPDDEHSYEMKADALVGQRRWLEAERAAQAGLEINPESASLLLALARAIWGQNRREESLVIYRESVLASPNWSVTSDALAEQVARYLVPVEKAYPAFIGVCLLSILCWLLHTSAGVWGWWALLWSILILIWGGAYVLYYGIWVHRFSRSRYEAIPPEVQRHLWLAKAFDFGTPLLWHTRVTGGLTLILLLAWTIHPAWSPQSPLLGAFAIVLFPGYWLAFVLSAVDLLQVSREMKKLQPPELQEEEPAPPMLSVHPYDLYESSPRYSDYDLED